MPCLHSPIHTLLSTLSTCCRLNFSSVGGVNIDCDVLFSPFSYSWLSTSIDCEAMPLSMGEKLGGDKPYKTAADDGETAVFPMFFGLLLTLDLTLAISILGLGIDML